MCSIGQIDISIIGWSKITVASNNDTIRCMALEPLYQRLVSVVQQDELRQYFRSRHTAKETVQLAQQRQFFRERLATLQELMVAVS
jgi:hypothetical protein